MKVYVLSSGEYSDWTIEGIFSSLESLEAGKTKIIEHNGYTTGHFNDPDEYELNEILSLESGPTFGASIYCESGEMFNIGPLSSLLRHPSEATSAIWDATRYTRGKPRKWAIAVKSPISVEHAVKIATEKRQEWLRNQATVADSPVLPSAAP